MVVVLRRELEQLHDAGVEYRLLVEDLEQGLEFFERQIGTGSQRMHHAHELLPSEGHTHPYAGLRRATRLTRRQVIEQPAQRCIERDPHNGPRQGHTFKVFHSVGENLQKCRVFAVSRSTGRIVSTCGQSQTKQGLTKIALRNGGPYDEDVTCSLRECS